MTMFSTLLWVSGAVVAIAVVLYFIGSARTVRIPSVILGTVGGIGLGTLLGLAISTVYEQESGMYGPNDAPETANAGPQTKGSGPPGAPAGPGGPGMGGGGGMRGGGGMGGGGMGGGMGGGGRGPNPKTQLVQLITKLDQLTLKPLVVTLDDEQKAKVQEQLKDLKTMDDLSADDAKKRLDALLAVVEGQRETLEAAGYRWPGGGGGGGAPGGPGGPSQARNDNGRPGSAYGPPGDAPNPFSMDDNAAHLDALSGRLGSAPASEPAPAADTENADEKKPTE